MESRLKLNSNILIFLEFEEIYLYLIIFYFNSQKTNLWG